MTSDSVTSCKTIETEVEDYLSDPDTATSSLLKYPHLLQAFIKFNAALPSSAAVERLFSCAGQILVPRRCKLSDNMFEKLVFLRCKLKCQLNWNSNSRQCWQTIVIEVVDRCVIYWSWTGCLNINVNNTEKISTSLKFESCIIHIL